MKPISVFCRIKRHVARDACRRCRRAEAIQRSPGVFLAGAFLFFAMHLLQRTATLPRVKEQALRLRVIHMYDEKSKARKVLTPARTMKAARP